MCTYSLVSRLSAWERGYVHIHLALGAIADGITPVTWYWTLYFWHMKDEISGQVSHFILINYICSSAVYIYIIEIESLCRVCFSRYLTSGDRWYADQAKRM